MRLPERSFAQRLKEIFLKDSCDTTRVLLSLSLIIYTSCQMWLFWNRDMHSGQRFVAEMQRTSQRISQVELSLEKLQQTIKKFKRSPGDQYAFHDIDVLHKRTRRQTTSAVLQSLKRKISRLESR